MILVILNVSALRASVLNWPTTTRLEFVFLYVGKSDLRKLSCYVTSANPVHTELRVLPVY